MAMILLRSKVAADPGVRPSAIRYEVAPGYERSILAVTSYHIRDPEERHVASVESHEHDEIKQYIVKPFKRYSTVTAGKIDTHPPFAMTIEMMFELDLETLFNLRAVNSSARGLISEVPEFRAILQDALDLVCILLRTRAARQITLRTLYAALCKRECDICHIQWGSLIHLMTAKRVCSTCVKAHPPKMVSMASAKRVLGLPNRVTNTIPAMYTLTRSGSLPSVKVVPLELLLSAYEKHHHGALVPGFLEGQLDMSPTYITKSFAIALTFKPRSQSFELGVSCKGCRLSCGKGSYFDPYFGTVPCLKYKDIDDLQKAQAIQAERMVYTDFEFLEHFEVCKPAQMLWEKTLEEDAMMREG